MTAEARLQSPSGTAGQPRAAGAGKVGAMLRDGQSVISQLRMSGALKLLFPRPSGDALETVLVNSAGGLTGGDRFRLEANAGPGARLSVTTQAAERAYRAHPGEVARVTTHLTAGAGASLAWLPQETILFDGCALERRLRADLEGDAALLLAEPVAFGRLAMGESITQGLLSDRFEIFRDGRRIHGDATRMEGPLSALMDRPAVGGGARAMALVLLARPGAGALADSLRAMLPDTAGASAIGDDLLAMRFLAPDTFELRRSLVPVLTRLSGAPLPKSWMT